jgi:lactoylglutathione lyase
MKFRIDHINVNVADMEKSLAFYKKALGLGEVSGIDSADGSFAIKYLGDGESAFRIELTWLKDKEGPYELGDNETHIALKTKDFDGAYKLHSGMGIICYENKSMGIYFIEDPDGYWIEICPE